MVLVVIAKTSSGTSKARVCAYFTVRGKGFVRSIYDCSCHLKRLTSMQFDCIMIKYNLMYKNNYGLTLSSQPCLTRGPESAVPS